MMALSILGGALMAVGIFFFVAGTTGLLRFPDFFTRLHAITKADNLGLGFVVAGLALTATDAAEVVKLLVIWMAVLAGSATACYLTSRAALRRGMQPWRKR